MAGALAWMDGRMNGQWRRWPRSHPMNGEAVEAAMPTAAAKAAATKAQWSTHTRSHVLFSRLNLLLLFYEAFMKHRRNSECCPVSLFFARSPWLLFLKVLYCQKISQLLNDCHLFFVSEVMFSHHSKQMSQRSQFSKVKSLKDCSLKVFSLCICHCRCIFVDQDMFPQHSDQMGPGVTLYYSVVLWNVWLFSGVRPTKGRTDVVTYCRTKKWQIWGIGIWILYYTIWPGTAA